MGGSVFAVTLRNTRIENPRVRVRKHAEEQKPCFSDRLYMTNRSLTRSRHPKGSLLLSSTGILHEDIFQSQSIYALYQFKLSNTYNVMPACFSTTAFTTPPRPPPRIKSAPKIRQLYWCDFPQDAQLPEFWKRRPIIILSYKNSLYGAVLVVPCSTQGQPENPWAFSLQTTIDGKAACAICDKPTTVALGRLVPDTAHQEQRPRRPQGTR
jgi:mRNA interferase MazF